ncbi:MAG: formylglycine-generating enzyme family protein, partial [Acidobacteria bacterium]|nr:formylglycine-generating enzyme family protein [Acidobacteriota bacterium]
CVSGSDDCSDDEWPVHEVEVPSFALSNHEVTRGQFRAFVAATGHDTRGGCVGVGSGSWRDQDGQNDDHPVVCVNWDDAQAYVRWLRGETGGRYRLPSESEWEYAARAGTTTSWFWGDRAEDGCEYADAAYCDDGWMRTTPVGSLRANGFGLHDIAGNVWEWVEDCWHNDYDGAPRDGSAWTRGGNCGRRVLRGGSWIDGPPRIFRSAFRNRFDAEDRYANVGIRVARTPD